jgi:hypothetical protein
VFGYKIEEVAGEWTEFHSEELHSLRSSLNVVVMVTPRRMGRTECTEFMEETRNTYKMLARRTEEETPHGDLGLGVRILNWKIGRENVEWI